MSYDVGISAESFAESIGFRHLLDWPENASACHQFDYTFGIVATSFDVHRRRMARIETDADRSSRRSGGGCGRAREASVPIPGPGAI